MLRNKTHSRKLTLFLVNVIFRAHIREEEEKREAAARGKKSGKDGKTINKETMTHLDVPIEENLNRMDIGSETATNLDEAITVLRYEI